MRDVARFILEVAELCGQTKDHHELSALGRHHMRDVITVLSTDRYTNPKGAPWAEDLVLEAWEICYTLNWSPENHQRFIDDGGLVAAFRTLDLYRDVEIIVHNILLTVHDVCFTRASSLINDEYLARLMELARCPVQVTSYLSCQVLACLLHKGSGNWNLKNTDVKEVSSLGYFIIMPV